MPNAFAIIPVNPDIATARYHCTSKTPLKHSVPRKYSTRPLYRALDGEEI
jgi:hypothetical protein